MGRGEDRKTAALRRSGQPPTLGPASEESGSGGHGHSSPHGSPESPRSELQPQGCWLIPVLLHDGGLPCPHKCPRFGVFGVASGCTSSPGLHTHQHPVREAQRRRAAWSTPRLGDRKQERGSDLPRGTPVRPSLLQPQNQGSTFSESMEQATRVTAGTRSGAGPPFHVCSPGVGAGLTGLGVGLQGIESPFRHQLRGQEIEGQRGGTGQSRISWVERQRG